jgi:response regulator RpfG family c-di-GMP phosphodiesterase
MNSALVAIPPETCRILCVDDEPNILTALRRVFRPHGYRVFVAASGAEGLSCLEQESVDIVISDMRMPGMDGAAFLEQVCDRWPNVVRLLLTGHSDIEATIGAINRGEIHRYISKPWDENDARKRRENRWYACEVSQQLRQA